MCWIGRCSPDRRPSGRYSRRGAAAVEFGLVAAPLFVFIFASIEFSRALMVIHSLEEASRSGCRVAILEGGTSQDIQTAVADVLRPAGVSTFSTNVQPLNPAAADRWSPISVTVTASFADMTWLPLPNFLGQRTYLAACTLPKESSKRSD